MATNGGFRAIHHLHWISSLSFQGWRVFGCPKSTFDLVAKVEDDIKELEVGGWHLWAEVEAVTISHNFHMFFAKSSGGHTYPTS